MIIESMNVKNFRSILDETLDFEQENTFGVGPREAIDFVGKVYKKRAALGLRVVVLGLKLP